LAAATFILISPPFLDLSLLLSSLSLFPTSNFFQGIDSSSHISVSLSTHLQSVNLSTASFLVPPHSLLPDVNRIDDLLKRGGILRASVTAPSPSASVNPALSTLLVLSVEPINGREARVFSVEETRIS
jgi:hypothetical protein